MQCTKARTGLTKHCQPGDSEVTRPIQSSSHCHLITSSKSRINKQHTKYYTVDTKDTQ